MKPRNGWPLPACCSNFGLRPAARSLSSSAVGAASFMRAILEEVQSDLWPALLSLQSAAADLLAAACASLKLERAENSFIGIEGSRRISRAENKTDTRSLRWIIGPGCRVDARDINLGAWLEFSRHRQRWRRRHLFGAATKVPDIEGAHGPAASATISVHGDKNIVGHDARVGEAQIELKLPGIRIVVGMCCAREFRPLVGIFRCTGDNHGRRRGLCRSEEHTSELQS